MPKYERRIILCTPAGQDIQSIPWNGVPYPQIFYAGGASFTLAQTGKDVGIYLMEVENGKTKETSESERQD